MARHCKECLICQSMGKPNQNINRAPLVKAPHLPEPFNTTQVDIVVPLRRTKRGNEYLLTMVDVALRYANAVPLRKVTTDAIWKFSLEPLEFLVNCILIVQVILWVESLMIFVSR